MKLVAKRPINPAYPLKIKTLGDHIRKNRLDKGLSQPQIAKIIGVSTNCILDWELNRNPPRISLIPSIISFLGYNPLENGDMSFGERIKFYRYSNGMQVNVLAKEIGIDPATLIRIENDRMHYKKSYLKVSTYLKKNEY